MVAVMLPVLDLVDDPAPVGIVLEQVDEKLRGCDQVRGRAVQQRVELAVLRCEPEPGHRRATYLSAHGCGTSGRASILQRSPVHDRLTATPTVSSGGAASVTHRAPVVLCSWWPWTVRATGRASHPGEPARAVSSATA